MQVLKAGCIAFQCRL